MLNQAREKMIEKRGAFRHNKKPIEKKENNRPPSKVYKRSQCH